jgi:hypothetical protein
MERQPSYQLSARGCGWLALATTLAAIGLSISWFYWVFPWQGCRDYSKRSPTQTFAEVTGFPPPDGVRNLRISGRSYALGLQHWVWMTFDASDAALAELTRGLEEEDSPKIRPQRISAKGAVLRGGNLSRT